MIDWTVTHKNVTELLKTERLPWHYKMLFTKTVSGSLTDYAKKTDPVEKFRQYYAEHHHDDVTLVPGGWLVLRKWFPDIVQLKLFPPEPIIVSGDCIVSYEAGFEQASRQPFMYDHFNDANSPYRQQRRQRAALVESHVQHFFAADYPEYYHHPSNHLQYKKPAKDDFSLVLPGRQPMMIDVKSWSYKQNGGQQIGVARNVQERIIYLWSDWEDDQTVAMYGICSGKWLSAIGLNNDALTHIADNLIWPMDCLLVLLNMTRAGQDYEQFRKEIASQDTETSTER